MANSENLKPMNKRTKSEQREIAKKGGENQAKNEENAKNSESSLMYSSIWMHHKK